MKSWFHASLGGSSVSSSRVSSPSGPQSSESWVGMRLWCRWYIEIAWMMLRIFDLDVSTFASARYFITETLVMPASRPMIVITTISSISVKPCIFLRFMTTASGWTSFREVPDLEDRQQDRDDDE